MLHLNWSWDSYYGVPLVLDSSQKAMRDEEEKRSWGRGGGGYLCGAGAVNDREPRGQLWGHWLGNRLVLNPIRRWVIAWVAMPARLALETVPHRRSQNHRVADQAGTEDSVLAGGRDSLQLSTIWRLGCAWRFNRTWRFSSV